MPNFSQTKITGHLGFNPEERTYGSEGKKLWKISVGVTNFKKITTWFKCTTFRDHIGESWMQLHKGSEVTVVGEIEPPKVWVNKAGENKVDLCLIVNFLPDEKRPEPKPKAAASAGFDDEPEPAKVQKTNDPFDDSQIPF